MAFVDNPILNSPYRPPTRHFHLNEDGTPTGIVNEGRRRSEHLVPIPAPRKRGPRQAELDLEGSEERVTPNDFINELRGHVERWRALPPSQWGVTYETETLIKHWRTSGRETPLFFCQIEAAETVIWLTEVAPTRLGIEERLRQFNAEANPELFRIAMKMATGSGKTTVMAMLIAWQAVNKARHSQSRFFSDAFLIVTPGITIKDRLRVLLPSDPENYYEKREIVPREMLDDVRKARIVITNYHAFRPREKLQAPKLTKQLLQGRRKALQTAETEGEMIARVCPELMARRGIVAINDEAHHCYRHKVGDEDREVLTAEEKEEAKKNAEAARVWISGLEAVKRKLGVKIVYDLSATPFFLRGSGYKETTLFPWVVSDFSLMDAIESGVVKVPRVPVSDDQVGADLPIYRHLWPHVRERLPRKGRAKQKEKEGGLDPAMLPSPLLGALQALYGHYDKVFGLWQQVGQGTPPVFIIVCSNTSVSKLVYDYVSGYENPDAPDSLIPGALPLFSNVESGRWLSRPRTLLIDSEQLDSGEALSPEFKKAAAGEIEAFKRELRIRFGEGDAEKITDEDLLREVMNTVGKPGRLGEQVRCVVSVSMLTEGWDANTVTHILGVRAFGTQLLCEQVVGRGLRRVSYDADGSGMLEAEYADVLGVPFTFAASAVVAIPKPPKAQTRVFAQPARTSLEIRFPRVLGYRMTLPSERLTPTFTEDSRLVISPDDAPTKAELEAIVGEGITITLDRLKTHRVKSVAFHVAGHALRTRFRDEEGNLRPYLFPQLLRITERWITECVECKSNTFPQYLLWKPMAEKAVDRIYRSCVQAQAGEERLRPILDPYNREGSTRFVDFRTTKTNLLQTDPTKCHVNFVVCDSNWEAGFAQAVQAMPEVLAYVKNQNLGFEVPYVEGGEERRYRPDFILLIDEGRADGPLHLVVEVKGFRDSDAQAKADTMRKLWVPAVNNHGAFGRWAFLEHREKYDVEKGIRAFIASLHVEAPA